MHARFGLTLMVTRACNMRCTYCYAGAKSNRAMPEEVGRRAIGRAIASLAPGGALELGFFGGEPLLEAGLVGRLVEHARARAAGAGVRLAVGLTTNGTRIDPEAWAVLTRPDLDLAVSCDGLAQVHDRHRRFADGRPSSRHVLATMRRLRRAGKSFRAATVVRPDTLDLLAEGLAFLRTQGASDVDLSLDAWARWEGADLERLERAIGRCARVWREGLPGFGVSWFDEKAALLAGVLPDAGARCGFGEWEVAVAPSGRLYPCERLIGEDAEENPMRLTGHALEGGTFPGLASHPGRSAEACSACAAATLCGTTCQCNNFVRTGDASRPDRLLCALEKACLRETAAALDAMRPAAAAGAC